MTRTRTSARAAGSRFERQIADVLAAHVDDRIDRRVRNGAKDRGDIGGVRTPHGLRVVVECKDAATLRLGPWHDEAVAEMGNDGADVAVVAHKRRGRGDALDQWVSLTVRDLIALLTGSRPDEASSSAARLIDEEAARNCPDCEGTGKVLAGEDRSPTRRTCNHPKVRRSA